jgi:flagellar basal-body rod modification protein FlgD
MTTNNIDTNSAAAFMNPGATTAQLPPDFGKLDQQDFLQLLTVELSSQDPLEPKSDSDFIAQVMQISSLEQNEAVHEEIKALRQDQQVLKANALLGQAVEFQQGEDRMNGEVASVQLKDGIPMLEVDGEFYDLANLYSISRPNLAPINNITLNTEDTTHA